MTAPTDIVERMQARLENCKAWGHSTMAVPFADMTALFTEIERLRAALQEWDECAEYDAMMEGPRFKGWNRSALDRCRAKAEARRALEGK